MGGQRPGCGPFDRAAWSLKLTRATSGSRWLATTWDLRSRRIAQAAMRSKSARLTHRAPSQPVPMREVLDSNVRASSSRWVPVAPKGPCRSSDLPSERDDRSQETVAIGDGGMKTCDDFSGEAQQSVASEPRLRARHRFSILSGCRDWRGHLNSTVRRLALMGREREMQS